MSRLRKSIQQGATIFGKKMLRNVSLAFLVLITVSACSTGQMNIKESHYYAVKGKDNTNIFRLTINAATVLGESEYRSGWFPANAVDSVFGDVSSEGGAKALEARREIEAQLRKAIVDSTSSYLDAAKKMDTTPEHLNKLLEARRRVLAYPVWQPGSIPDSFEIEYNPGKGLATLHADEKLIFILSSNPNEVVGKIANFAESDKTVYSINQFAKITAQRARNDIAASEATAEVRQDVDKLIHAQIRKALVAIGQDPVVTDRQIALNEIDVLLNLLDRVQR